MAEQGRPTLVRDVEATTILFAAGIDLRRCERRTIEAVLDFNEYHEPIGIEIGPVPFSPDLGEGRRARGERCSDNSAVTLVCGQPRAKSDVG